MFDVSQIEIDFVDSTAKAFECLRWASDVRTPIVAVDVETSGLDWFDGKLRLVQFGTLTQGWAIPFEWFPQLVDEILAILTKRKMPLVGHNFKFDLHWLDRHTIWSPVYWGQYHDTLLLSSVMDSSGSKALKDLSVEHVSSVAKSGQMELKKDFKAGGWDWATVPVQLESYWVYGVLDTILTANLWATLLPQAHGMGVMDAYGVEQGCVPALYAMERKGLLLDADHARTQDYGLNVRMDEIQNEVRQFGIENIGSNDQLIRAFLDSGVTLTKLTDSGNKFSMDKKAFEDLEAREGKHPLVALVSEYRKAKKYSSSYYQSFLKYQRSDGRVHPAFNQAQARTGRMSAQFPAVQTIPRPEDNFSKQVRNSFVADEGSLLISTDFSNVEARIFAEFAQEQGMIDAFKRGIDIHGYTAQQVYKLWAEEGVAPKDHPLRQVSKNTIFCMLFGGGPAKVALTAGVDIDTAQGAFDGIHKEFPGIKVYQKEIENLARRNLKDTGRAWVRGIDGRILMMKENDDRYYAFTNWMIQGTATVLLKQRLAAIHNMGLTDYCALAIHDEVVAEVPETEVEDFGHAIMEAMEDYDQFSIPIIAESGKPSKRLGDAK